MLLPITFFLITSSIHVWTCRIDLKNARYCVSRFNGGKKRSEKKKKKYTRMRVRSAAASGPNVNSIPENFTLLTATKWSNSDICVNKANPPGDCARPGNSRVRERDYPHSIIDFIWLIKRLSRFPHSTSLSLDETVTRRTLRERSTKNVIYIPLCREIEIFAN